MKQKYEHIQLLRAIACIGVFVTHLAPRLGATGKVAWLANQGAAGVYLFFVISGYLACCDRKFPTAGKKEILTYYKKRLVRILPLYYAVILYNIFLHGFLLKDIPADPKRLYWLRYFFLTNSVIPAPNDFWGNISATWTISLFVAFYLLAPVFVRLIRGSTSAFFAYVLSLILRYLWIKTGYGDYMMIFYYLHYFLLGILVWEIQQMDVRKERETSSQVVAQKQQERTSKTGARTRQLAVYAALLAAAGLILWLGRAQTDSFILWSWCFGALLIAGSGFHFSRTGIAGRVTDAVLWTDRYSYEIYLVHAVVLEGLGMVRVHIGLSNAVFLILALLLTGVGAILSKKLIEDTAIRLVARNRM